METKYHMPVMQHVSPDIKKYKAEIYQEVNYSIDLIYQAIEKRRLKEATIPVWVYTIDIYDIWDDWYNIFTQWPDGIDEAYEFSPDEAVEFIKEFITNHQ